jgi:hypothetical protein
MDAPNTSSWDAAMARVTEMVLDQIGIPRPGAQEHARRLQGDLLPYFLDGARQAWTAASPVALPIGTMPGEPSHPTFRYLQAMTELSPLRIGELNRILEDMGVHALLDDIANSPDVGMIAELPVDPCEIRLLRATGHPSPERVITAQLQQAAANPSLLRDSEASLKQAEEACLKAHKEITIVINIGLQPGRTARVPLPTFH